MYETQTEIFWSDKQMFALNIDCDCKRMKGGDEMIFCDKKIFGKYQVQL